MITVTIGAAVLFGTGVHAQQQPSSPPPPPPGYGAPITLEQARAAIAAGAAESKKNGWNHVFAVVDGNGTLIAFEKADLASNSSSEIAQAKAKTAATFRVPTKAYQDRISSGETFLLGLPGVVPRRRRRTNCCRRKNHRSDRCERRHPVARSPICRGRRCRREVTTARLKLAFDLSSTNLIDPATIHASKPFINHGYKISIRTHG